MSDLDRDGFECCGGNDEQPPHRAGLVDQETERTMLTLWLDEEDILGDLPACMSPGGEA